MKPQGLTEATPNGAAKHALFEPIALLLLALATAGTAWCSFQAAAWGGVSQRLTNLSAASSRRAAASELQSYQLKLADVFMFSQYVNARASSNETLARFYADRFRGEARSAFEAWMATRPFENTDAPLHPFVIARAMHLFATTTADQELELGKVAAAVEADKLAGKNRQASQPQL